MITKKNLIHILMSFLGCVLPITAMNINSNVPCVGHISWSVSCCSLWRALNEFTIEKTGTQLGACTNNIHCQDMKIIHKIIGQIEVIVGKENMKLTNNYLNITLACDIQDNTVQLLALSVIGRVISKDTQGPVQLVYDTQYDKLTINRPTCEYSKSIYNSIVLASVVLLIFFIGMQVIEQDSKTTTPKPVEESISTDSKTKPANPTISTPTISLSQVPSHMQMRLPFKL